MGPRSGQIVLEVDAPVEEQVGTGLEQARCYHYSPGARPRSPAFASEKGHLHENPRATPVLSNRHIFVHRSLVRKMGGLRAFDTEGNEIVALAENGARTLIVSGPTANYVLENPPRITLNHLTHSCHDGVRDFSFDVPNSEQQLDELHDSLRAVFGEQLEEYNRDLGFLETEDGELVVVSDVGELLAANVEAGSSSSSSGAAGNREQEATGALDATVGACMMQSGDCGLVELIEEPKEETMLGKKGYNIGVVAARSHVMVELLVTNSGGQPWPVNTQLKCVSGTGFGVPELDVNGGVKAGETVSLTMGLETAKSGESYWVFTDGQCMFGPILSFTVV